MKKRRYAPLSVVALPLYPCTTILHWMTDDLIALDEISLTDSRVRSARSRAAKQLGVMVSYMR